MNSKPLKIIISCSPSLSLFFCKGDSSTISAKPQLRNIRAELTKFVPTAVKIQRNPSSSKPKARTKPSSAASNAEHMDVDEPVRKQRTEPTKDDIYAKFMREMDGFL